MRKRFELCWSERDFPRAKRGAIENRDAFKLNPELAQQYRME
jgi:hypothetical protein